ncbi:exodeoxyribonuclease V beta chain [Gordonia hirsuta DSM 44140 = NBRC 16056]|uniref:RecBCD enzyme subunit RecB n=1 Tax=Gordonia hirsuta DSM 44140 = NBRC 16056 TaxID=1121927 RepID=L7L561_9ACTN|nr:UvrD-helicase domain-containing protein [Gordonia hirsuta]GAC56064.1 exodeoxyribonuclease V beta chain [Gordonia hirsuta DSM 44140 = NBRC 16056]
MTTTDRTPRDFDLRDPLPTGTVVLEASAGTGKTYAIVALAVRYLAEGTPVDRLLMATFSNAASNELRDRTRARLAECVAALGRPAAGGDDELVTLLRRGTDDEVEHRRLNLAAAMSDFDSATVATTHTFCNRMLAALGFLGERAQQFPILENVDEMVAELTRDLYLSRFAGAAASAPDFTAVATVTEEAVNQPGTALAPDAEQADEATAIRLELAAAARRETDRRKRLARVRTYDDLQNALHTIIDDAAVGEAARSRIAEQFSVVLIDEFQDTDPQQWAILQGCFHGRVPLILVGDPKQSIYGFRGAEVRSYLSAVAAAADTRRLVTNWRSDGPLVDALAGIFAGATFGDPRIAFHPVGSARGASRLHGTPPVRLRAFLGETDFTEAEPKLAKVRAAVTADVADDIAELLNSPVTIDDPGTGQTRPVQPGDIAVLVRTNSTVDPLQHALAERGISAVVRSGTSIFKTPAARHWWYVLAAIEQPSNSRRVRLAALTPLIGITATRLDAEGDEGVGRLAAQLAELGRVFGEGGFASLSARLFDAFDTDERLLGAVGGERLLTDLRQLADLCNGRMASAVGGLASLTAWLGAQIDDPSKMRHGQAQTRRLDRDARAVQIMTIHASKGLEFPIVYVPFGWDGARPPQDQTQLLHDAAGNRRLDVGGKNAPGFAERRYAALSDEAGDDLRLLYVTLTRAASQVVLWWAPSGLTDRGPLHRLLFTAAQRTRALEAGAGASPIDLSVPVPMSDEETKQVLLGIRDLAEPGLIAVEAAGRHGDGVQWDPPPAADTTETLTVACFDADIDQDWARTSYSAIVRFAHGPHTDGAIQTSSEPEDGLMADEPVDVDPEAATVASSDGTPSLMNGLPFGAAFGTLVHEVLEHVDTSAPDLAAHVYARTVEGAARSGLEVDTHQLARALTAVLTTPLGFGDLAGIAPPDRLAELDFELPLAAPGFTLEQVGDLLEQHLPADDPLSGYAHAVRQVSTESFRGYLTGSIDSVLRIPDGSFAVVDYKTNRLRPGELTAEDFHTEAMAQEMVTAHYPLQALLYSVALHRYLRWRLPGYRPEVHLGPVQYHFVRGMIGPDTPRGCGVFDWRPPPALITDLSDLLAGTGQER